MKRAAPQRRPRRAKRRAVDVMTAEDIQRGLGIGKNQSYELAHKIGIQYGRRWLIPRDRYERILSGEIAIPAAS